MNPYALNDVGIGSWPARRARMTPQRTALRFQGRSWTHGELYQRTEALSRALQRMGVHPGDRVAYLGNNHPAFLETLFAVGHLGAIFVPLNTRLSAAEIAYMLDDSGSAVLLVGAELAATAADAVGGGSPVRHIVLVDDEPTALPGALPYEQVLSEATDADPVDVAVGLDDPCMIIYTSGTTGRPKGAVITHGNVTWNAFNQLAHVDVLSDDVVLAVAPLFHTAGLNQVAIPALYKGSAVVLMPRMDAGDLLATIESERITAFSGVPTILQMIADHPAWDSSDLSSLRHVVYGGSPVSERVAKAWLDRGVMLLQGYGMTEASPGVFMAVADGAADRPVSIGVPHFFTDVAVLADGGPGQVSGAMAPGPRLGRASVSPSPPGAVATPAPRGRDVDRHQVGQHRRRCASGTRLGPAPLRRPQRAGVRAAHGRGQDPVPGALADGQQVHRALDLGAARSASDAWPPPQASPQPGRPAHGGHAHGRPLVAVPDLERYTRVGRDRPGPARRRPRPQKQAKVIERGPSARRKCAQIAL
jgi:fatty-acyl-CoA synthase